MELAGARQPELLERLPLGYGGRFYGVYPALVSDNKDPAGMGRVQIQLPWSPDPGGSGSYLAWARIATLMGGPDRGTWFIPEVNDEVLVCFEGGDPRRPYVMGMLWNGKDQPPETMDSDGKNNIRSITSRSGIKITFDDTDQKEKLALITPLEQSITLQDDGDNSTIEVKDKSGNSMLLDKNGMIFKDKNGMTITQSSKGVEIKDPNSNAVIQLDGGKVEAKDQTGDALSLASGTIEAKNSAGHSVTLAAGGVETKAGPAKVAVAPAGVDTSVGPAKLSVAPAGISAELAAGKIAVEPAGVSAQYAASSVKAGPAGVDLMGGPSILKVGLDGVSITALRVAVTAPMIQLTGAMVQCAGVVQCSVLMATTVVSPTVAGGAYSPGGGNML